MMSLGVILLSAGSSTRLGSPKQLLNFSGRSLLRHAAETALGTVCRPAVAVLGAGAERMRAELVGLEIHSAENPHWEQGMGSSLRVGLTALMAIRQDQPLGGVLLMLCDQPLIVSAALDSLVARFCPERGHSIVAASYNGNVGVPAVIGSEHFRELLELPDQAGAKKLLLAHSAQLVTVPLPDAAFDIDTREQYDRLIQSYPQAGNRQGFCP